MNTDRFQGYLKDIQKTVFTEQPWEAHEKIIDASLKKYVEKHQFKNVLDVGCGTGYTLEKFMHMGIVPTGITLDGNEFRNLTGKGLNVYAMDMAFLDFEDEHFDLVWCRHALEHSVMPYIALREFHSVLKDNGYIYVEVPSDVFTHINNESHYSMLSDLGWQVLFRKAGFTLIDRGQYTLHLKESDAPYIYWNYWMKKERRVNA